MKARRPTPKGRIQLDGKLSAPQARALLKLGFSQSAKDRMRELSAKARAGTLSPQEAVDADYFEHFGCLLDVLHSTARRALRPKR
jgi:hypothetical protein